MSGTPIDISKVKHIIRRYESGIPKKDIEHRISISKNAVKTISKKLR